MIDLKDHRRRGLLWPGATPSMELAMGMSPALFVCLFLAALGVFFLGAGFLWWVSLQAQETKRRLME